MSDPIAMHKHLGSDSLLFWSNFAFLHSMKEDCIAGVTKITHVNGNIAEVTMGTYSFSPSSYVYEDAIANIEPSELKSIAAILSQ